MTVRGAIGGAIGYGIALDLPDAIANTASSNPRFHLLFGLLTDAVGGLKALVTGQEGAWGGFQEGLRDAAAGEVESFTFGGVKGAFGADVTSSAYATGRVGGAIGRTRSSRREVLAQANFLAWENGL